MFRLGYGYDVHRLSSDRKLILGGVTVPFEKGLLGHSDADVLIHAIIDAMLGALALGDIGIHFPDSSAEFKGIDSRKLLRETLAKINKLGWQISNLDSTICAQAPRLAGYIDEMRVNIAEDLNTSIDNVSVKATTEEGLGISGRGEGITAYAVVLLSKIAES
ncbi:MAG TPA: 2-C-methyl-D-erythritol 2,4-cyclodiphosphate synthase [Candidatus Cloacimonadota bacterium]|nr:2-C-methyl-D-erythritol 2,4-cyclodiphosphate synthase [Candidatus Cloacimonadota bacterium]HPS39517.1 2-C-methyl-D-erythritol 2,4-cyclodiphosphate synthase [Candidatus Cloacimonadota bacterium]